MIGLLGEFPLLDLLLVSWRKCGGGSENENLIANASVTIREEAKKLFSSSPFYKPWDEKVLDVWVECGLKDKVRAGKNEGVELKMLGIQVRFPNTRKLIL